MYTLRWLAGLSAHLTKKQWHAMYKTAFRWPQRVACAINKRKFNNACLRTTCKYSLKAT